MQNSFSLVDAGGYGRDNDAGLFAESSFGQALFQGKMALPEADDIHEHTLPYVIIGDDIFPLKLCPMKPYGGKHLPEESTTTEFLELDAQLREPLEYCQRSGGYSADQSVLHLKQLKILLRLLYFCTII